MSVYLTLNEINDIAKRFNGNFISGWLHYRFIIMNNKNEPIPILRFKKQEGNKYKICLTCCLSFLEFGLKFIDFNSSKLSLILSILIH